MRQSEITREDQMAEAVKLVHGLLGDRPARRVVVAVTRGGTFTIEAEAGEESVVRHQFKTGRK
jgi:hypothetical protein